MKWKLGWLAASAALAFCLSTTNVEALDLYHNDVNADFPGIGITPNGVWAWTSGANNVFTDEVTETAGVGGSQSFRQTTDSTLAQGTSWYFSRGFGQQAVFADANNLLAGGVAGSDNPSRYRFSMDVKLAGNNGWEPTTPLFLGISGTDNAYEAKHNIDVNNDGDFLDGAEVYKHEINPTITVSGDWVNVGFTLNQGTPQALNPNVLPEHNEFSNELSLQWYISYNSAGFNFDADNVVDFDNFRIEFLDSVAVEGDHNGDGNVDILDYVVWRQDPDSNGGPDGYADWAANYGGPGGAGSGQSFAVPEPSTAVIGAMLTMAAVLGRRRRSAAI